MTEEAQVALGNGTAEPSGDATKTQPDTPRPWGEARLLHPARGTQRHRELVLKRDAAEEVLEWVEKVRSWIPAWKRAVRLIIDETAETATDPDGLEHALESAKRFWVHINRKADKDAMWSPYKAYNEAGDHDAAARELSARHLPSDRRTAESEKAALYADLVSTVLVGEHAEHLTINLQEAAACWPQPPRNRGAATPSEKEKAASLAWRSGVHKKAQMAMDALDRALQHALFLTFVRDAEQALPGERRDIDDYCEGWGLTDGQVDDIWGWLTHDSPHFGGRRVELAVDRQSRCVYRKPCTLWQKSYTLTASLWGGLLAFGATAGVFALLDRAGITSWPEDWPIKLVVLFLFVAAGAGLHLASRSLSSIRFDDPLKVYASAEGWDWLRLRWIAILRIYIPIAIVAGSLWGAGNIPASFQDIGTAVLAGFTADSVFRTSLSAMQAQAAAGPQTAASATRGISGGRAPSVSARKPPRTRAARPGTAAHR